MAVDLDDFALFDPAIQQCPHPYYAQMRATCPIFVADAMGIPIHLVTRHEDVLTVLRDPVTFSSEFGTTGIPSGSDLGRRMKELYEELDGYDRVGTMLTIDPPEQTRYRKLVSKAFTPKMIGALEPSIRELSASLIDAFIDNGRCEFVDEFAVPLPVTVIAKALNVPDDRLDDFKRWSDDSIAGIGTDIGDDARIDAERGVIEFQHYFAEQLNNRRSDPQDDILTGLLQARLDRSDVEEGMSDEPLTMAEMLSILQQLLVAGNETTTKVLTEAIRLLAEHPEEWERLRADPSRAAVVAEETLRLSTPTQGMWRIVTQDTELGATPLPAGTRLVVMFASANRTESLFPDPDDYQPDREGLTNHIAFGKGTHYCLGANLARLELRVALEELSRRLATLSLPDSNEFLYDPSFMLRGLTRLDLEFTPDSS